MFSPIRAPAIRRDRCERAGSVPAVLDEIGTRDIEIRDNKARRKLVFIAFLSTLADDPDALRVYREVREEVAKVPEAAVPELA